MDWPALRRSADAIGPDGRARLLRILGDDGARLEELPIELEEKEWARQAAIEELRRRL